MVFTRLQLIAVAVLAALLLMVAVVQTVRLDGFLWIPGATDKLRKCERDRNELRAQLDDLASKSEAQKAETGRTIIEVRGDDNSAHKISDRIRSAPTAPNCDTPPEIMGATL